ncbi:MAG: DinB family protein [Dehalococcoidales bacterium]|nr:DinB family protein [Dehalococcoidales bacterium]
MNTIELMLKFLDHSEGFLTGALDGLTQEEAAWTPTPECNSILFTLWHMTRLEDHWVNTMAQGKDELYDVEGWQKKLGTPPKERGAGYTLEQLQAWPVPKLEALHAYHNATREKTLAFLKGTTNEVLSEVIPQHRGDPEPRSLILGRIFADVLLHVGQITYLRGIQRGINK